MRWPSRSVGCAVFAAEKSSSELPDPMRELRETLPYVPVAGGAKAVGSNHFPAVCGHSFPWKSGFQLGRTGLRVSPLPVGL